MAGDPHWASVVLALHMDGANNSTTFTDAKGKTVTPVANAKISTAQSKFGGASAYFDGTGDLLTVPMSSADFNFTGDYTLEFFYYPVSAVASNRVFQTRNGDVVTGIYLAHNTATQLQFYHSANGSSFYGTGILINITQNVFQHIAIARDGNTIRAFVNGVQVGGNYAVAGGSYYNAADTMIIGGQSVGPDRSINGYLDDLRVTKGVARYTANFTPPETAFLEYVGQLFGTVKDDAGVLCARTVRAYRRSDGSLSGSVVSNATTGAYTINTLSLDAHTVIALDDGAGTQYNALVLDNVTPT